MTGAPIPPPEISVVLQGIRLTRTVAGECVVSVQIGRRWIDVIRDRGEVISHIVEPAGLAALSADLHRHRPFSAQG